MALPRHGKEGKRIWIKKRNRRAYTENHGVDVRERTAKRVVAKVRRRLTRRKRGSGRGFLKK